MEARGLVSTGLINLNITLRLRWGGIGGAIICSTGVSALGASLNDVGWSCNATCLITDVGADGEMEIQGYAAFASGVLSIGADYMPNTSPIALNTTITNDVVVTAQWANATANNQIQVRTMVVEVDGP